MTFRMTENESRHSSNQNLNWVNIFGLALLSIMFLLSFWNFVSRAREELTGHKKVIRFAHWRLEGPTITGYEAVARAYMELHPDVEIQQMPIPLRIWPMWVTPAGSPGEQLLTSLCICLNSPMIFCLFGTSYH